MELNEIKTEFHRESTKESKNKKLFDAQPKDRQHKEESNFQVIFSKKRNHISMTARGSIQFLETNSEKIILLGKAVLLLAYFVYFGFALNHHIGDEGSWRLIGCTVVGVLFLIWNLLKRSRLHSKLTSGLQIYCSEFTEGNRTLVVKW